MLRTILTPIAFWIRQVKFMQPTIGIAQLGNAFCIRGVSITDKLLTFTILFLFYSYPFNYGSGFTTINTGTAQAL